MQTEPAKMEKPLTSRNNSKKHLLNDMKSNITGVSGKEKRPAPVFRRATEEIKRLTVKRNKITKRISTKDRSTSGEKSYAPQS